MKQWKNNLANHGYRGIRNTCCRLFYSRVTVLNSEYLPNEGPVIYLALHRNGAVDGFVYQGVLPRMRAMLSRQLRKSFFARMFFNGIEVVRRKDVKPGEDFQALSAQTMQECVALLEAKGELLIFPEGTSSLGPSHLPFKGGAARIAAAFLEHHPTLTVIPIGIRYECPEAFRSRVEVCVGKPLTVEQRDTQELRGAFNRALEAVGVNVASSGEQERIHQLAYASTLGTDHDYYRSLKYFEASVPPELCQSQDELEARLADRRVMRHQGIPLFPIGAIGPYALILIVSAPLVAAAMILNALPLLGGWLAARKLADDRNVIALWKILVGAPLFALWALLITIICIASGAPALAAGYAALTAIGIAFYYRVQKLGVAVFNAIFHADLRPQALAFRETILSEFSLTSKATLTKAMNHELHPITK